MLYYTAEKYPAQGTWLIQNGEPTAQQSTATDHLFPGAIHFLRADGMSGTKERESNFLAELGEIKRFLLKEEDIFLLTPYVMYSCHILEKKGQDALSVQSKLPA